MLLKIHKINKQVLDALLKGQFKIPPGRPIISQCGTPTEKIGHYCDHVLVSIVQKQNSDIKDTSDFILKIESLIVPENAILVTYDVTSIYTNMEFDELLHSVEKAYLADNSRLRDSMTHSEVNMYRFNVSQIAVPITDTPLSPQLHRVHAPLASSLYCRGLPSLNTVWRGFGWSRIWTKAARTASSKCAGSCSGDVDRCSLMN